MRTEDVSTMPNPTQPDYGETKNRHERRAAAAIFRAKTKKLKKHNQSLKKMFDEIGIDPNQVETWDENKVKEFKDSITEMKEAISPLKDLAVNS